MNERKRYNFNVHIDGPAKAVSSQSSGLHAHSGPCRGLDVVLVIGNNQTPLCFRVTRLSPHHFTAFHLLQNAPTSTVVPPHRDLCSLDPNAFSLSLTTSESIASRRHRLWHASSYPLPNLAGKTANLVKPTSLFFFCILYHIVYHIISQ